MTFTAPQMEQLILLFLILVMLASALSILRAWRPLPGFHNRVWLVCSVPPFLVSFLLVAEFVYGSAVRLLQ